MARPALFAASRQLIDGERGIELAQVRRLTEDEHQRVLHAWTVFRGLTERSAFTALIRAEEEFRDAIESAKSVSSVEIPTAADLIQRRFTSWLSAFRSFDDHTAHWLSETFGDGSLHLEEFRGALSTEYDCNFAYRASWALRNASQHAGHVIDRLSIRSTRSDAGELVRVVEAHLDGPMLADRFERMKAAIKAELRECDHPLDTVRLATAVRGSCERAMGKLILSVWPTLEPLAAQCDDMLREAMVKVGRSEEVGAWVLDLDEVEQSLQWDNVLPLPTPYAAAVREDVQRLRASSSEPWRFTAEMFAPSDDDPEPSDAV